MTVTTETAAEPTGEPTTEATTEASASDRPEPAYHLSIFVATALVLPALVLVADGNLSVDGALLRFACALVVAAVALYLIRLWLPGSSAVPFDESGPLAGKAVPPGA